MKMEKFSEGNFNFSSGFGTKDVYT